MLSTIADAVWSAPVIDYHALAPEIVLGGGIVLLLLLDLFIADAKKWVLTPVASFTLLAAFIPVLTLSLSDAGVRSLFDGRYVVDDFSLVLKGLFLLAGYVVVLLSADHIREGVVVRPSVERYNPKVGRVVMKYVSDDYLCGDFDGSSE